MGRQAVQWTPGGNMRMKGVPTMLMVFHESTIRQACVMGECHIYNSMDVVLGMHVDVVHVCPREEA